MKLMRATGENLKTNYQNYDHLKIVTLIKQADKVFEKTLKDIKLMSNMRSELEYYKYSSFEGLVNILYSQLQDYYNTVFVQAEDRINKVGDKVKDMYESEGTNKEDILVAHSNTPIKKHKDSAEFGDFPELEDETILEQKQFQRSNETELKISQTILEVYRLQKFETNKITDILSEKLREN